jgi:mono/diheme cytochrome c family protein
VVFQPLADGKAAGNCEVFADGFAGAEKSPGTAAHRPTGVATGPDGSLFVSDDVSGRIYKIVYRGGAGGGDAKGTPCPSPTAAATDASVAGISGDHHRSSAAAAASLPVAHGATRDMVLLGEKIYRGDIGGAACSGCHGTAATGTALGPNLTGHTWLWSDGSYAGIAKTITSGVSQPKQFRSAMPPMGGAELTPDQVSAVAAYIWGLSHHGKAHHGS